MKLLNRLLLAFLAIGIISCSNDEPSIESSSALQNKTGEEPEIETFDIKVSYRGKMYVVPCEYVNDSLYYLNEEFNDLFINEISKSENIITSYNPET